MSRILIATLGSLGDLNPALMLGRALVSAGHQVRIAANSMHEAATRRQGLEFAPLGRYPDPTDLSDCVREHDMHDEGMAFIDHANFSQLDALHDDLSAAAEHADVLLAAYYLVPAHIVAARRGIPLLAYTLSPAHFFEQPGVRARTPIPARWNIQLAALRRRQGLPLRPFPFTAIFTDPARILGVFPRFLLDSDHAYLLRDMGCAPIRLVGYCQNTPLESMVPPDPALLAFCDERTAVFSFGSFVDRGHPQHMFDVSVAACRELGLKCLYLSRYVEWNEDADDVMLRPFVDHASVFPLVGTIVHHAGLGTLAAACAAAKPMVTVPFLYDQPYHAQRMAKLIDAPIVPAAEYGVMPLVAALRIAADRAPVMKAGLRELMAREEGGFLATVHEIDRVARNSALHRETETFRIGDAPV